MADLSQHTNYTGAYSGLVDNLWVTLAIAGACLVGYEIEVRVPRRRGKDGTFRGVPTRIVLALGRSLGAWRRRRAVEQVAEGRPSTERLIRPKFGEDEVVVARRRLGSREAWEFGYIFQPKAWRLNPCPPVPRWPLAWIWSALKVREKDMPDTCGLDLTLHMRFIRGSFFYTLLQAIIIMPILMPLHIIYAPETIANTSMLKASIASLVESQGSRWLWVHAILIWWVTITWTLTVLWITWGALAYRRREIRRLAERIKQSREEKRLISGGEDGRQADGEDDRWTVADDSEGIKKFRTLMVTNIPPDMRDEDTLRHYFDHYLHQYRERKERGMGILGKVGDVSKVPVILQPDKLLKKQSEPKGSAVVTVDGSDEGVELDMDDEEHETEVDEVILVRKLGSVASLRARRTGVLKQLEVAHVKLAQRVLKAVSKHKTRTSGEKGKAVHPVHDMEQGIESLNAARNQALPKGITKKERLDRLVAALGSYVDDEPAQRGQTAESVWDVLHALPRELLDPYQALTHMTSLFRDQNAPLIDYLTTKLSYLTSLVDEARSQPLSSYEPASTAFVTFKDARTARFALKVLDSHPKRSLACHTTLAPDWTDLIWSRLAKSAYRAQFVRGWVVFLGVWAFTLIWIFPISLFCTLTSLTNIAGFIPSLANWLNANPKAASAITSLAPVILVALLTLCICPLLLLIANKAETIVTRLGIHNSVLERFWKFLMVNGVVFFAIGQTAIEAYLTAFQDADFDPLPLIASAFPTAAPYFASYILLQTAIQPFFEVFRFGLATIIYVFGTRASTIPRQRSSRTEHPTFSHFSQLPQQLLGGAIMHLFCLLNPLVIPFTLVYYGALYVVWKRQFTYVYGRLYENNGRRSSVRILRYSLDALALAQFVLFAFFILNKAKEHAIATGILFALTLGEKLVITRALKRRFDNLDIEEGDILCPAVERDPQADDAPCDEETVSGSSNKSPSSHADSKFNTFRRNVTTWAEKWGYATSHRSTPTGYRKPIPFDHVLFSSLDRKITFVADMTTVEREYGHAHLVSAPESDAELVHPDDRPISHPPALQVVVPHHSLRPWEDIPSYQRMRGYGDQPAYTDDYDDFLWLPRDPLSTLDLDDTVELRLALTTSAGGSGRFGDWPPLVGKAMVEKSGETLGRDESWELISKGQASPEAQRTELSPIANSDEPLVLPGSPDTTSRMDTLPSPIALPPTIGSEVEDEKLGAGIFRRGTVRIQDSLAGMFTRPRSGTLQTHFSGDNITLRTMSRRSSAYSTCQAETPSVPVGVGELPVSDSPQEIVHPLESFLSPGAVSTPDRERVDAESEVLSTASTASTVQGSASRVSFPGLGRSIARPRPSPALSKASEHSFTRLSGRPVPHSHSHLNPRSPSLRDRSPSVFSSRSRERLGTGTERNVGAMSAAQQAMLAEVMEEERRANEGDVRSEREGREREAEQVRKERERNAQTTSPMGSGVMLSKESERGVRRSASRFGIGERRESGGTGAATVDGRRASRVISAASSRPGLGLAKENSGVKRLAQAGAAQGEQMVLADETAQEAYVHQSGPGNVTEEEGISLIDVGSAGPKLSADADIAGAKTDGAGEREV